MQTKTQNEIIAEAKSLYTPSDYSCEDWDEVIAGAEKHVDGFACGMGFDDIACHSE